MSQHDKYDDMQAQMGGLDPLSAPVPGESLTQDPEAKQPFEKPPVQTNMQEAIEDIFIRMTDEERLDELINLMRSDVPVEDIAQVVLFGGFRAGQYNPDLMLMMLEPVMYILLWIADYADVIPILSEQSSEELIEADGGEPVDEETDVKEILAPEGINDSLLSTIKEKLGKEEK